MNTISNRAGAANYAYQQYEQYDSSRPTIWVDSSEPIERGGVIHWTHKSGNWLLD
jgi:hypothetical protein